jgi:hypothetical protein
MQLANLLQYVRYLKKGGQGPGVAGRLSYCKTCNLEDFANSSMRELLREIFPHDFVGWGQANPAGNEARNYWQTAMTARAFADFGVLGPRAQLLGVGAANQPIIFWLTNQAARVFAADEYMTKASRAGSLCRSMLLEPELHWAGRWNRRRLVVQHLGTQHLHYRDETFDGVFAPHALEACESDHEVGQALEEMYRVLKPGGILSLIVEFAEDGSDSGCGGQLFDAKSVFKKVIAPLRWKLQGKLDLDVSSATQEAAGQTQAEYQDQPIRTGQFGLQEVSDVNYSDLAIRHAGSISVPLHLTLKRPGRLR